MWRLCLCGIHYIFCFCFFKHIVLKKDVPGSVISSVSKEPSGMIDTWTWLLDVCSVLLDLACSADSSRECVCICIYTQACMHTYVLHVLVYILCLISEIVFIGFFLAFPIPYFYVPSSESWLPKKSVFQLFNPYNSSKSFSWHLPTSL